MLHLPAHALFHRGEPWIVGCGDRLILCRSLNVFPECLLKHRDCSCPRRLQAVVLLFEAKHPSLATLHLTLRHHRSVCRIGRHVPASGFVPLIVQLRWHALGHDRSL
uniref:Uncharacterized protein n=1 Tax=uncultured marine virus TaxID=186617 RepID=A0A0F7L9B7_9VIRU|nr:hypothetical protein [uncultured marine virus]